MREVRLAPLAGITDWPFRLLCFEQGCDCACTEMVSALGYVYAPRGHATLTLLEKNEGEGRLLLQLFGKDPDVMARAAEALSQDARFAGIDLNMGCPAHKVACSGEGSGLMRTPEVAGAIMRGVVKASRLPVSVKFRLGWDAEHINVRDMARLAEDCGVSEMTVHGRTRVQMYSGQADWDRIGEVKQAVKIPVFGNGDIFTAEQALHRLNDYGLDGVVIGRGAMGNPWLFAQIRSALRGETFTLPTPREKVEMALRHYRLLLGWKPERIAVGEMRKHIGWYIHGLRGAARMRDEINKMNRPEEVYSALMSFAEQAEALPESGPLPPYGIERGKG